MTTCTRPALRYAGSKWRISEEVIAHFPPHQHYVEPFGGSAAILLRKPRCVGEVYNDLNGDVVNFFRVLQDPKASDRLLELLKLTPFARGEFERALLPADDPIERARRLAVMCNMGHGATASAKASRTGFRAHSVNRAKSYAEDWARYPFALAAVVNRLRGVVIENRPAMDVMARFDAPGVLIYADPPYLHETRRDRMVAGRPELSYAHELTDDQHRELLAWLSACRSMVVLSGYPSDLYDELLPGWLRVEISARISNNAPRTECLWINPAAAQAAGGLFAA